MVDKQFSISMFGHPFHWRNLSLSLLLGGFGSVISPVPFQNNVVLAQATSSQQSSFLQGLLQLNQDYLAAQGSLSQLPAELSALDRGQKAFDAEFFTAYLSRIEALQQQLRTLETQFGGFEDSQQQLALKSKLEQQLLLLQNTQAIAQPFSEGFSPDAIREVQEFLDFFEKRNLPDSSYGFYGSVTETEITEYLKQQLNEFATNLKDLNQLATKGAIAPDLATSITYLYTTLSLENTLSAPDSGFQQTIERLEEENESLEKRIKNTHRIIIFLPLIVMLPTTILVFILFYYFGKIMQDKASQPPNYQFSLNDIYGLEDELLAKLSEKYELKPRLLERRDDPFANKLISLASSPDDDTELVSDSAPTATSVATKDKDEVPAILEPIMEGEFEEDDEDFPVNLPNVYDDLVDNYNDDAAALEDEAIALAISHQESYLDDESEFTPMLLLTEDEEGDYWAMKHKLLHYLTPKADLSVTKDNYASFKNIFICYGYHAETVQKAKLLKPARVSVTEEENTWELVQQGIVVLHRI